MSSKRRALALLTLAALAALAALGALRGTRRVQAQTDQLPPPINDRISFGMVGVTRGQTVRINSVNTGDAVCPCNRVILTFVDAEGQLIRRRDGSVVHRALELEPGRAFSLELDADDVQLPPGPTDTELPPGPSRLELPPGPIRVQLRAVVTVQPPPIGDSNETPPPVGDRIVPSVEVFNNATGRTVIFMGDPGRIRGFNPQPDPPGGD